MLESSNPYQSPAAGPEGSVDPERSQLGSLLVSWSVFPFLLPLLMIVGVVVDPEIGEAGGMFLVEGTLLGVFACVVGLVLRSRVSRSNRSSLAFRVPVLTAIVLAVILGTMHVLTDGGRTKSWLESLVGN